MGIEVLGSLCSIQTVLLLHFWFKVKHLRSKLVGIYSRRSEDNCKSIIELEAVIKEDINEKINTFAKVQIKSFQRENNRLNKMQRMLWI